MENIAAADKRARLESAAAAAAGGGVAGRLLPTKAVKQEPPSEKKEKAGRTAKGPAAAAAAAAACSAPPSDAHSGGGGRKAGGKSADAPFGMTRSPVHRSGPTARAKTGAGGPPKLQRRPGGLVSRKSMGKGKGNWKAASARERGRGGGGTKAKAGKGGKVGKTKADGGSAQNQDGGFSPDQKRATGICRGANCDRIASFGFPGTSRLFCAKHQPGGMVNLTYQNVAARAKRIAAAAAAAAGTGVKVEDTSGTEPRGHAKGKRGGGGTASASNQPVRKKLKASGVIGGIVRKGVVLGKGKGMSKKKPKTSGGGGGGGGASEGDGGGGAGGGNAVADGTHDRKKLKGAGGGGKGGGGGASSGDHGRRFRVWESGSRCGLCGRKAKLGCSSESCFECCLKSGKPCEAHAKQVERKHREDELLLGRRSSGGGGGGGAGGSCGLMSPGLPGGAFDDGAAPRARLPPGAFKEAAFQATGETATLWCLKDFVCGKDTQTAMETLNRTERQKAGRSANHRGLGGTDVHRRRYSLHATGNKSTPIPLQARGIVAGTAPDAHRSGAGPVPGTHRGSGRSIQQGRGFGGGGSATAPMGGVGGSGAAAAWGGGEVKDVAALRLGVVGSKWRKIHEQLRRAVA
ncbi:expressed unknown protein [Ectocarpus siliculosus]|uniref:Uncharacterized protein n=1 Tax=Ectocarpus siliculosus TaxID=2880 RepID=D8LL83_ECTSI|nr:expressed unknown protein [Ectocarpus siliculosus]|eukprot:CBN76143.1 expressed unknown protein [Ectocarpus siliculosus]